MNVANEIFEKAYTYELKARVNRFKFSYINGTVLHSWHGPLSERMYSKRYAVFKKHGYNPKIDIVRDRDGVISLSKIGERMHDDLKNFFCAKCS